jgi:hypothetical protein
MRASKFTAKLAHEKHGSSLIFRTGLFFCLLIDLWFLKEMEEGLEQT